jgi:hypothetical protein
VKLETFVFRWLGTQAGDTETMRALPGISSYSQWPPEKQPESGSAKKRMEESWIVNRMRAILP